MKKHIWIFISFVIIVLVSCSSIGVRDNPFDAENTIASGVFTDSRDGQVYNYVEIGEFRWMVENLRYLPQVNLAAVGLEDNLQDSGRFYYVYDYDPSRLIEAQQLKGAVETEQYEKLGVLYNWVAAMDDACPDKWRLPSDAEWQALLDFVEIDNDGEENENAGFSLKSSMGWNNNGSGGDEYGFRALPGGYRSINGDFSNVGDDGYWWTATRVEDSTAWTRSLNESEDYFYHNAALLAEGLSIRCVQKIN